MVVLVGLAATGPAARAQARPPPDPSRGESFDGRPHPPTARDDLLVVPRLVLTPPRLLYKGIFWPLGAAFRWSERHKVPARIADALTTADGMIGVRPVFNFVTGYRLTFGLGLFDRKILGEGTALNVSLSGNLIGVVIADAELRPTHIGRAIEYVTSLHLLRRDDYYYSGIGMETARTHTGARFSITSFEQGNELRVVVAPHVWLRSTGIFAIRRFGVGIQDGGDKPIDQVYCVRLLDGRCIPGTVDEAQVPGYHEGTQFLRAGFGVRVDTRDSWYRPSTGAAFEADVDYSHGLGASDPSSYFRTHLALVGVLDLWKRSRTLLVRIMSDAVWPTNDQPVPFFELPALGGPDWLRGARWGKYRDYTNLLFTAEYRWPIWMWMDASLFVDYGATFGKNYAGFDIREFIPAIGAGVRLRTSSSFLTRIHAAYGFGEGFIFGISGTMDPL